MKKGIISVEVLLKCSYCEKKPIEGVIRRHEYKKQTEMNGYIYGLTVMLFKWKWWHVGDGGINGVTT